MLLVLDIKVLCYYQHADQQAEESKKEKEEIISKLLQAERNLTNWKSRVNKLEEDNAKLRRALEQSMTRLNRMSMDSDYLVDRLDFLKLTSLWFVYNFILCTSPIF